MIYANREDPSVFVPQRFGVGWTMNVARPATWLAIAGFAAITAAFALLVSALA